MERRQYADFVQMLRECDSTLMKVCFCFTNRRSEDFRDLYQEIVCTIWQSWSTFRGESSRKTWVTRIALNVAGQEVRRRKRMPQFVQLNENYYCALAEEATEDRHQRLYDLIDRLESSEDRKLLFLYLDHVHLKDIADIMGGSEASVKQKIYRLKQLLNHLAQDNDE